MNVLILEDDERRMKYFRMQLIGADIYHAKTPLEAISLLRRKKIDTAFLDHDLTYPGRMERPSRKTGWWVAKWLKENPRYKPTRIFIHTLNPTAAKLMQAELPDAKLLPYAWYCAWDEEETEEQDNARKERPRI